MFIRHSSERMSELRERVNREDKENKSKKVSLSTIMRDERYDFKEYGKLVHFGNNLFNHKLSLEEAINEQNVFLGLINQLEISVTKDKKGRPFSEDNKNIVKEVTKNLKQAYETRNLIIDEFENTEGEPKKQSDITKKSQEESEKINPNWLHGQKKN